MKLETNLVHENGQYIHDGDPFYEGDKLVGWFRGFHNDGGPIAMINVEKPNGGGVKQFYIGVVESWDTGPATPETASRAPHPDEVCSSPEQAAAARQPSIEALLLQLAKLPFTVEELVKAGLSTGVSDETREAARAALGALVEHDRLPEIPF